MSTSVSKEKATLLTPVGPVWQVSLSSGKVAEILNVYTRPRVGEDVEVITTVTLKFRGLEVPVRTLSGPGA
jgi:hypothetical protein